MARRMMMMMEGARNWMLRQDVLVSLDLDDVLKSESASASVSQSRC